MCINSAPNIIVIISDIILMLLVNIIISLGEFSFISSFDAKFVYLCVSQVNNNCLDLWKLKSNQDLQ